MRNRPFAGLALLTDLDGTLLTPEKTLFPADAAAIADFRREGGLFSFATGRGRQASEDFLNLLKPDFPAAMYNGALLYDPKIKKSAGAEYLPAEAAGILRDLMRAFPEAGAEVLDESGVYVIQDGAIERRHLELTHVPIVYRDFADVNPQCCMKSLFAAEETVIDRMFAYVREKNITGVNFTRSHRWFLEILPLGTNKGTALQKLRTYLPAGTVIGATGDFDNDAALLLAADVCGCPADAQPCIIETVQNAGGFVSEKTCANGFYADWIAYFTRRYAGG